MVASFLRGARLVLRSRMSEFFLVLLVFTVLMILTQHTTTWQIVSPLSLRQHTRGSAVLRECRQFTKQERMNFDFLYYIQDLSKKKSLIWCKVPKAGSSSLSRMFIRLAGASEAENSTGLHKIFHRFYPQPPPQVMTRRLNTTFKFLVVRHPFERIVSAYRDKIESSSTDPWLLKHWRTIVKRPVQNEAVVYPTFQEFVTYLLLETNTEKYNRHWMPIYRLCSPCKIHYDAIVKMENYSMEIKVPLGQVGIYEDIGWEHSTGTNQTAIENYFQQLSSTQIQKLYQIYREDFLLFDYTPNQYFALVAQKTGTENCTSSPVREQQYEE